jgi:cytochrome d ubiquinol oxidase subunit II
MSIWLMIVAAFIFLALVIYALTGGADFGGGVWDLLASGPRKDEQRKLVENAIGPIWEANHVWLIVIVVLLFVGFPEAFYALMVALHLPLFLMLLGIVLRGSSFVFRAYRLTDGPAASVWARVFAISSAFTPILLGISLGAVASGGIRVASDGSQYAMDNVIGSWLQPFPFAMGIFVLVLFTYLAAIYLAAEAKDEALREDFRTRALAAAVGMGLTAFIALYLARSGAPLVWEGLTSSGWSVPFHIVTGALAVGTIGAVITRRYGLARMAAGGHVTVMISGWAAAQFPYIIPASLTFEQAATDVSVLRPLSIALLIGFVFLIPAFLYLYRIFKPGLFGIDEPSAEQS